MDTSVAAKVVIAERNRDQRIERLLNLIGCTGGEHKSAKNYYLKRAALENGDVVIEDLIAGFLERDALLRRWQEAPRPRSPARRMEAIEFIMEACGIPPSDRAVIGANMHKYYFEWEIDERLPGHVHNSCVVELWRATRGQAIPPKTPGGDATTRQRILAQNRIGLVTLLPAALLLLFVASFWGVLTTH